MLAAKNDVSNSRLGMVVAKRKVNLAVKRNHIKRLIRAAFKENSGLIPNSDIVVVVNNNAKNLKSLKDVESLFIRLKDKQCSSLQN